MYFRLSLLILALVLPTEAGAQVVLAPQDGQFQVSEQTTLYNYGPAIAMASSGDFVVVWRAERQAPPGYDIVARRYASNGDSLGTWLTVSDGPSSFRPQVDMTPAGDFVVVWHTHQDPVDTDSGAIRARRFGSDGQPLGAPFLVNTYTTSSQLEPDVAVDEQGAFAVVWHSFGSAGDDTANSSIQLRRFDSAGSPIGSEVQVNSYTSNRQRAPAIVRAADDFIVAWESAGSLADDQDALSLQARRLTSDGAFLGDQFQVNIEGGSNQEDAALAADAGGRFLVAWTSYEGPLDHEIRARLYDSSGTPLTGEIDVNSTTDQRQRFPAVTAGPDGHFAVVWESDVSAGTDSSNAGVQLRTLDSSGTPVASDFQVNSYTTEIQEWQDIATDGDGRFVVTWMSYGSDTSDGVEASVQAQRLEPAVIGNRVWLDEDADGLQDVGEIGFGGITVHLLDATGIEVASTTTDANGLYGFSGIATGEYRIEVVPPTDGVFSSQDVGDDDLIDSDVDPVTGRSEPFNYTADSAGRSWDAGLRILPLFADGFESGDTSGWSSSVP